MTTDQYRAALEAAIREYEDLGRQRREIDERLAQLAQTIGTLNRLLGLAPTVPLGLTDAVRLVVRGAGVPVTPVDVRDRLRAIGFDLTKYANDLAAVHTILKRLNESGELRFIPQAPGKHKYMISRPATPVVLTADILKHLRDNTHEREAMQATQDEDDASGPPPASRPSTALRPRARSRRTKGAR